MGFYSPSLQSVLLFILQRFPVVVLTRRLCYPRDVEGILPVGVSALLHSHNRSMTVFGRLEMRHSLLLVSSP
ncbi:hypothetical protein K466DRAFT_38619 [Polyporus arcularius HHB13444]|uniref:Secreted protein n=1 Tax=Polyporus arcularius HHB13444 TaxID=1314778 RepID=A0A5C3PI29_9APHY|nr:hypothetical protein K466DRAFT_38619 [Polyporus arcularius HHB13444]